MGETREIEVGDSGRLDKRLAEQVELSRSKVQDRILSGNVDVNGVTVTDKSERVETGDVLLIEFEPEDTGEDRLEPDPGPLTVLHEDETVLAVEKPAGMVVHPNPKTRTGTLVNRIITHFPEQVELDRAGLVHRLDKGTSGVILFGRTRPAVAGLKEQFKDRTVKKTYCAILGGRLDDESVKIDVPVGRDSDNPMLRQASPGGKRAVTVIERVASKNDRTAVRCYPSTGRTHQIRVHCNYINCPIVGDNKYNGPDAERLMLHAKTIEFNHPIEGNQLEVSSDLPEEVLQPWLEICES